MTPPINSVKTSDVILCLKTQDLHVYSFLSIAQQELFVQVASLCVKLLRKDCFIPRERAVHNSYAGLCYVGEKDLLERITLFSERISA